MFAALGQFVVKVANLAEAEGRLAVGQLLRLAMVVTLFASSCALVVAAVAVLAAAAYVALASSVHPAVALVASALVLIFAAAVLALFARSLWLRQSNLSRRTVRHES